MALISAVNNGDTGLAARNKINTALASVDTANITDAATTYAKIQDVSATDKVLGRSTAGAGDIEEIPLTSAGRALIDDVDASAQRTTLGLEIGSDVQAYDADTAKLDIQQSWSAEQNFSTTTALVKSADNANTSITPVLADGGTQIRTTAGTAVTFTLPLNASVAYPIGTVIAVFQAGAGLVTFAAGGTTINSDGSLLSLKGQYTSAALQKVGTDTWDLVGNLA